MEQEEKPFGRPSKYTPELLEAAANYAEDGWKEHDHPFPSIVGLCKVIKITSSTAHEWASHEEKKAFSDTLNVISDNQHLETLHKGITGEFNSAITKLVLHNHGYSDKTQQELSGPDGKPIQTDTHWTVEVIE